MSITPASAEVEKDKVDYKDEPMRYEEKTPASAEEEKDKVDFKDEAMRDEEQTPDKKTSLEEYKYWKY